MTKKPERSEGRRRAGVLARRQVRLLQPGRHAGQGLRVQQGPERADLRHPAARPRDRRHRELVDRAPAARCGRRRRPTASRWRSCAASSTRRRSTCMDLESGARDAALRRPRARPAGDLGDPRRLPGDGWTPDSRVAGVLGAAASSTASTSRRARRREIPFHVRTTRAGRRRRCASRVEVAPAKFPVKMLRWVEVSPEGDRVVYQALGHLWMRDLPDGTPRRLTRAERPLRAVPRPSRATASRSSTPPGTTTSSAACASSPASGGDGRDA